jgi:hypothetical protein
MLEIRLVNSVPVTLNMTPTRSNTGGIRSAQKEETSGASGENANPKAVIIPKNPVPYSTARVPAHRYSPATTSSALTGVATMAS